MAMDVEVQVDEVSASSTGTASQAVPVVIHPAYKNREHIVFRPLRDVADWVYSEANVSKFAQLAERERAFQEALSISDFNA